MLAALLISFFIHANLLHLVSNLWYLWIFGANIESRLGTISFMFIYGACGILSMIIQAVSTPFSHIPIVGASGAIAGIMGTSLVYAPFSKIVVWFPPIFFFRVPAFIFLLFWFWIQWLNLRVENPLQGGVAWWAHIGGFLCGALVATLLRTRKWWIKSKSKRRAK
jgi:hypothetical protein